MKGMPDCEDCGGFGWYWLLKPKGKPVKIEECCCVQFKRDMKRKKRAYNGRKK